MKTLAKQRNVVGWYYRFGRTTDTGSIFGVKVYYQNMIVVTVSLFRHVCIAVKSAYYLRHVLSFVFPYVSARLPMNGFPWNLIAGTSTRLCQENSNLVEIGQKYQEHITWTRALHIVGSDTCSATTNVTHCCVAMTTLSLTAILLTPTNVRQQ